MLRLFLLAVFLLWGMPVYAQDEPHPLVEYDLVYPLNLSQSLDGMTVTLDWAYADTLGFAVQLSFDDVPAELEDVMFGPIISNVKLRDTLGNEFLSGGSQINPVDEATGSFSTIINYYPQAISHDPATDSWTVDNDYFDNQYETLPADLTLQLELNIADPATLYGPLPSADEPESPDPAFEPIGPFIFDFELPLLAPVEFEPALDAEVHDLTMTLETLEVTPAFAEGRFCIELPDAADWQLRATINVNGSAGAMSGARITDMDQLANTEQRCFNLQFHAPHHGEVEQITVSLDAIEKSITEGPTDWLRMQEALAEQGIEMIINAEDHGIGLEMPDLPDDMTYQDAIELAREQLGDRIVGPWVFEIDVS